MESVLEGTLAVGGAIFVGMSSYRSVGRDGIQDTDAEASFREEGSLWAGGWRGVWEPCFAWENVGESSGCSRGVLSTLFIHWGGWCFMEKRLAVGDGITHGGSEWWVTAPGSSNRLTRWLKSGRSRSLAQLIQKLMLKTGDVGQWVQNTSSYTVLTRLQA